MGPLEVFTTTSYRALANTLEKRQTLELQEQSLISAPRIAVLCMEHPIPYSRKVCTGCF